MMWANKKFQICRKFYLKTEPMTQKSVQDITIFYRFFNLAFEHFFETQLCSLTLSLLHYPSALSPSQIVTSTLMIQAQARLDVWCFCGFEAFITHHVVIYFSKMFPLSSFFCIIVTSCFTIKTLQRNLRPQGP